MAFTKHIDDLFDECLVPVLTRVPFNDLVRHVPLTSQRWNALLHLAIRERTSLRLYEKEHHRHECNQPRNQFIDTGRVSPDDNAKYLQCLLNQHDDQQLYIPCDHYLRSTQVVILEALHSCPCETWLESTNSFECYINSIFPLFGLQTLETVVNVFPRLEHLGISTDDTDDQLIKLIPYVSQLTSLSSLQVTTEKDLSKNNFSFALTADQQIEYRIESLQVLRLKTYLRIDSLAVLRALFPNLRQFHLEGIHFQCLCFETEPTFFRLPSLRPPECTCKARIANHLDSFEYLPKISLD